MDITGNENNIAAQIDKYLPAIKKKYHINNNNQTAILCRGNTTIQLMDQALTTAHKVFVETPLDRDNSEWGRLFREVIVSCFDPNIFAVDYAEQLFSENGETKKYHKALELCSKIFAADKNTIVSTSSEIIKLAKLVYPQKENSGAVNSLNQILRSDALLSSYVPASEDEINLMTLHKSKGLEFNIVFHMDLYRWIFPNEYGDSDAQLQDLNLHYVGVTRAIDACYLMNGSMRYRKKTNDFISSAPSPFLSLPGLAEKRKNVRWE